MNGLNLYCYCYNDPINYYDPSVHFVITVTIGLSTAAYYAIIALLAVTAVGLGKTGYIASLPKPNLNEFRDEERIKSQRGRFIWDYWF